LEDFPCIQIYLKYPNSPDLAEFFIKDEKEVKGGQMKEKGEGEKKGGKREGKRFLKGMKAMK